MSKMTVAEASEYFKISKEAIHNRIRRGTLDCVIEHGTKYVVIGGVTPEPVQTPAATVFEEVTYGYVPKSMSSIVPWAPSAKIDLLFFKLLLMKYSLSIFSIVLSDSIAANHFSS